MAKRVTRRRPDDPTAAVREAEEREEREQRQWQLTVYGILIAMAAGAAIFLLVGAGRGVSLGWFLTSSSTFAASIGFVAIGLLELEWLERVIGFVDGIISGVIQFLWTREFGTLSENEALGRRGAMVLWVGIGILAYVFGCLFSLHVVDW